MIMTRTEFAKALLAEANKQADICKLKGKKRIDFIGLCLLSVSESPNAGPMKKPKRSKQRKPK